MALDRWIRWLVPREDHFYDFLEKQAALAHAGAKALAGFGGGASADDIRTAVQTLEHEGDRVVHEMEEALAKTFVTPLDREDLQKLSKQLDDILDLTNGAARVCVLFGVERPTQPMVELMTLLVRSTELLGGGVPSLRRHAYGDLTEMARAMRQLEKDGDAIFRHEVSRLFREPTVNAKELLREREVLEDLERAIDHCEYVCDTLANLAVKHG